MKQLHTDDIVAGDGQIMRRQMVENFETIQQELGDLRREIYSEEQDRKSEDTKLNDRIDGLDNLDEQKATHDDLQDVKDDLQDRINHLYAGDPRTIKAVVEEILKEKGVI